MTNSEIKNLIPDFADEMYPKGDKDRGLAVVAVTLWLVWLKKHQKKCPMKGRMCQCSSNEKCIHQKGR